MPLRKGQIRTLEGPLLPYHTRLLPDQGETPRVPLAGGWASDSFLDREQVNYLAE